MNEVLITALINQAFAAQEERMNNLKEENQKLKNEINALKDKNKAFEELHSLFDKELEKIREYVKTYVAKEDDEFSMEDYKYGQKQ